MKIIFKHSPICPVSFRAKKEVDNYLDSLDKTPEIEWIDVIANRTRSNEIADLLEIRHESPQIILLDHSGKVIWHGSHGQITQKVLTKMTNQ